MTDIIFRPSVSHSKSSNASNNLSATFDQDPYETIEDKYADEGYEPLDSAWTDDSRINYNSRQSAGGNESTTVNGRLQINRKLNSEGRNLTLTLNGGYSTSESFSNSTSFTRFYRNDSTSTINRYNTTPSKTYNYNTRIMWSEPLWTATFLQLSYQFNYRYNNNDRSTYNLPDVLDDWSLPEWILPDDYERYRSEELSRFATYENMDHDITAQLRLIREKYNMNVGFTLLPQHSKMNYQYMGYDIDTVRTVFNFTPTMNFRYRWSKQTSLRINYRGRSSQPSMTDLLPIKRELGRLDNLTIGLVGDLKYGRTVHSLIKAMTRYANTKFILIAPPELALPDYIKRDVCDRYGIEYREVADIESVIGEVDILYMTRVQQERFTDLDEYERVKDCFVLDAAKMRGAKEQMAVLHPLPRVNEIAIDVDDDPRAAYFRQVENGKFVRMALILKLLEWQNDESRTFDHGGEALACKCPNPLCISNLEPVRPRFEHSEGIVRCVYCESEAK